MPSRKCRRIGLLASTFFMLTATVLTQDDCTQENLMVGRYFHSHPTICTQFLQCVQRANGEWFGKARKCAPGLFWDTYSTSCRTPNELLKPCVNDPCQQGMDFRPAEGHCRSFFKCTDFLTDEMLCCEIGEKYEPETRTCITDITRECVNDVCTKGPPKKEFACRLETFPLEERFYYENVPGFREPRMRQCPEGTAFEEVNCGCTKTIETRFSTGCVPSLMLDFAQVPVEDVEYGHTIKNIAVAVSREMTLGLFRGAPARLIIPRYANQEWLNQFAFFVIFATQQIPLDNAVILSNSGCQDEEPSIKLVVNNNNILEGTIVLEDGTSVSVATPFSTLGLNRALFFYEEAVLTLAVQRPDFTESRSETPVPALRGNIARRRCAFQVGFGNGGNFFRGFIDQVQILLCN